MDKILSHSTFSLNTDKEFFLTLHFVLDFLLSICPWACASVHVCVRSRGRAYTDRCLNLDYTFIFLLFSSPYILHVCIDNTSTRSHTHTEHTFTSDHLFSEDNIMFIYISKQSRKNIVLCLSFNAFASVASCSQRFNIFARFPLVIRASGQVMGKRVAPGQGGWGQ